MKEMADFLKDALMVSSPVLLVIAALAYFVKLWLEKKIEGVEARVSEIGRTSLDIKKELRNEERGDLVKFRVALAKWEDCLLGSLTEYTMQAPSATETNVFYKKDAKLFLEVKLEAVKVAIYLRDEKLEQRLMGTILKIRNLYYPLISQTLPQLIDLQTQLIPIDIKLGKFRESGLTDMNFAPTPADLELSRSIQAAMTEQMKGFSAALLSQYRPIAENLVALKEEINRYIYRPIQSTALDRD